MIEFKGVSTALSAGKIRTQVLEDVTVNLPTDRRLVLLGHHGSGKSTVIKLIAGLMLPDQGSITRFARASYPIGYNGGFSLKLSARRNITHAAELYGAEPDEVVAFVESVTEMGKTLDEPIGLLPQQLRVRVSYALSYALPFDVYLIDGIFAVGDETFRQKCVAMLEARASRSGVILATRNLRTARRFGDSAAIIQARKIVMYEQFDDALRDFEQLEITQDRTVVASVDDPSQC